MVYNIFLLFFRVFSYTSTILLFFYYFLYFNSSYIFSGDLVHGTGSYLLVLHSSLALLFSQFLYVYFIFVFCIFIISLFNIYFYLIHFFHVFLAVHSLFGLVIVVLFFFSGITWGDYAWGFPLSLEYRFLLILMSFFLYGYTLFFLTYFTLFSSRSLRISFFLLVCSLVFVLFLLNYDIIFAVIKSPFSITRIELHQSDKSLHFFLLSISGYYISLIFIFYLYCFAVYLLSLYLYLLFFVERNSSFIGSTNRNYFYFFFS